MRQETRYQYDDVGNPIEKIDAKNQKTEYGYDDAGRLKEVRYIATPAKTVTFTYDKVGNLKTYSDGTTSGQYEYDSVYRKATETVNYGAFSKTFSYTYYGNGTKKTFAGPDSITYTYTYDANNQLTSVQIPDQGSITYTSYNWIRPTSIALPGGSKKDYIYDPFMRIKQITAKDPAQNVLMNYQYTYDKMDNIKTKSTEHGNYQYGYDDLYRLTQAVSSVLNAESYTYDQVGNRITAQGVTGNWSYNQNNELQNYNGVTFQYDLNGNTIQKDDNGTITNYIYNVENRLVRVEDGSGSAIAEYYYDPFARRLWKDVGGTTTYFLYADEGLVGEYSSSGAEIKTYGYRPDSTWTTDPIFMKEGGNYYFYHNDHLGTPQKLTSVNGATVWAAKYSSFGKAEVDPSSTVTNNLRFPGQYIDQETQIHYNYHRYYEPRSGRYIIPDPIRIQKGASHLYAYAKNNPIKFIDPFGLYNIEVHRDMTETGALMAHYSYCAAADVADADQGVDDNPETSSFSSEEARRLWHFASPERIQQLLNQAYSSCSLSDLGKALHVLQDSYSHAGFGPEWGHIFAGTAPDDFTKDMGKTGQMLRDTYNVLKDFYHYCEGAAKKCCM